MDRRPHKDSIGMTTPTDNEAATIPTTVPVERSPTRKVSCLTAAIATVVAVVWLVGLGHVDGVSGTSPVLAAALVAAFIVSEKLVVHLEVDREAHTFALSEVPLAIGLFFVSPVALLLCRLGGECIALGIVERQRPLKLLFNLSIFALEC